MLSKSRSQLLLKAVLLTSLVAANTAFGNDTNTAETGIPISEEVKSYLDRKQYAEAEEALMKEGDADPKIIGWLKLKQGKTDEGVKILRDCVRPEEDVENALLFLKIVGDAAVPVASEFCDEFLQRSGWVDEPRLLTMKFGLLQRESKLNEAKNMLEKLLATDHEDDRFCHAFFRYTIALYRAKKADEAIMRLEQLMDRFPEKKLDPAYRVQWAHIAHAGGRFEDVLKALDRLQTEDPEGYKRYQAQCDFARGDALKELGDYMGADREYRMVAKVSAENPWFAGYARLAASRIEEVRPAVEAAQAPTPSKQDAQVARSTRRSAWIVLNLGLAACAGLGFFWVRRNA